MKVLAPLLALIVLSLSGCFGVPEEKQMAPDHNDRQNSEVVHNDADSIKFKIPLL